MTQIDTTLIYKQLKKQNGEAAARIIRDNVLLDVPNIVHILEYAGSNPDEIRNLIPIIREVYKQKPQSEYETYKDPLELLSEAGYDAFVVKTAKQKNSIENYFRSGERLCTFGDPQRHKQYYMIHAVKHGAEKIKPSQNPEREDEYGTSVISIQIAKTGGFISIKNRYNHTVKNPDATFNNNPDNIIPGLSYSLKKYFDVHFNTYGSSIPDNFRMINNQLVRFNFEFRDYYIGPDYYFHGSNITKLNTDYEIVMDIFILNTKTGKIKMIGEEEDWYEQGGEELQTFFQNKKIQIVRKTNSKTEKIIFANNKEVAHINNGQITELYLPEIKTVCPCFLSFNTTLKSLSMPDLEKCGSSFLHNNETLEILDVPNLKYVGRYFMNCNKNKKQFIIVPATPDKSNLLRFRIAINNLSKKLFNKSKVVLKETSQDTR